MSMYICPIELEREKSYKLVYEVLSEGLNELQDHDVPRFDILHNMVSHANSLFCELSKLGVEKKAIMFRESYVDVLCQLFAGKYSLTRAIHSVVAPKEQAEYSWKQFKRDNPQLETEGHSFLD